tara:strand:- start:464 stop:640 length:177 start_codon:yes stop_codon:yes gene_type:complete
MLDFISTVIQIIQIIPWLVAGASLIAAVTPTPSDDKIIGKLYKVLDWFALNIGRAKEK